MTDPITLTDVSLGRVPGDRYGYASRLRVSADVRLERLSGVRTTTSHEPITEPWEFSLVTQVWRPHGDDIVESRPGSITHIAHVLGAGTLAGAMTRDGLTDLARLAGEHLNGMQAACIHQRTIPGATTSEALDTVEPCPVTGYRYGTLWLVRPIDGPAIAERLAAIFTTDH
jgi:hypothetical protein